jgi:hypothetical protein
LVLFNLSHVAHLECIRPVPPESHHFRSPADQGPAARPQPNQTPCQVVPIRFKSNKHPEKVL